MMMVMITQISTVANDVWQCSSKLLFSPVHVHQITIILKYQISVLILQLKVVFFIKSQLLLLGGRDPNRDDWTKEFIKCKKSSRLFWALGASEKNPVQLLGWFFQLFVDNKKVKIFLNIVASELKSYII